MESSDCVVAIVDDDVAVRRALGRLVRSLSYEPVAYDSGERFLASLAEDAPFCVVLDQHMPGLDGLDVLIAMRERGSQAPVIMVSGLDQPGMSEKCLNAGAAAYLTKPVDRSAIGRAIEEATAKS
jgi:FixJ family two-component response regulator